MSDPSDTNSPIHTSNPVTSALADAMHVLYVFDGSGQRIGLTEEYKTYRTLKQVYLDAQSAYATAYATAMKNTAQLQVWPITSKSLQAAVDNAYSEWRSIDAARIETAIEIVKRAGELK